MPESKAVLTEKSDERPVMNKRVDRKEDGRTLIYYTFDEPASREQESESEGGK